MPETYNAAVRAVDMPDRIKALPISSRGFPTPWFVHWGDDGVPDFRVIGRGKLNRAVQHRLCWTCGQPLGRTFAMVLGPMCVVNRTISEPPSHRDCAIFSARACPFLSQPRMVRREEGMPEHKEMPGFGIKRNPGAVAVWLTRGYRPFRAPGGVLFTFDDATEVLWFAEGRQASLAEVAASIESGIPLLEAEAAKEGPGAMADLARMRASAERYLPAA